jgi:hypothetical protein
MRYALVLLCVTFAGSALADPAREARASLGGPVDPVCLFSGFTGSGSDGTSIVVRPNGAAVEFRRFVDPDTALPLPLNLNIRFSSTCNFSHRVTLASRDGGITRVDGGVVVSGFAVSRNYTTDIAWAGGQSQFTTNGTAGVGTGFNVLGANDGGFDLTVSAPPSATPLFAGAYADVLTIQVSSLP